MSQNPQTRDYELAVVIADILTKRIKLLRSNPVLLYNQKFRIPPNDSLFLYVAYLFEKPMANNTKVKNDPTSDVGMVEENVYQAQEWYQIEAYSKGPEAFQRKHEVLTAMKSVYAQQQAEFYGFKIGTVPPSMTDLSAVEGSARLNRYALRIPFLRGYLTRTPVEAFTIFQNPPKQILTDPQQAENALQTT